MSRILRYFDLRDQQDDKIPRVGDVTLLSGDPDAPKEFRENTPKPNVFTHVIVLYLVLVFGIFSQPFLLNYQQNRTFGFPTGFSLEMLIFCFLGGFALFPLAYKKAMKSRGPDFVTLCSIFTLGLGWPTLLGAILKVVH